MRFWIAFLSFLVGITGAVAGEQSSLLDEALSVDRVVIQEINDEGGLADSAISTESMFVPYGPSLPVPKYRLDSPELVLDLIINLGKKIWTLVEANKPVVNVATDSASALPSGVKSWQGLQDWQRPGAKIYRVTYVNSLTDLPVVDFSFRLLYTYGGNVEGKGRYLAHVTAVPLNVSVFWGYVFNSEIQIPNIVNVGSHENPVAGMEVLLKWQVKSILKHTEGSKSFFVQGDGKFFNLTDGN